MLCPHCQEYDIDNEVEPTDAQAEEINRLTLELQRVQREVKTVIQCGLMSIRVHDKHKIEIGRKDQPSHIIKARDFESYLLAAYIQEHK